MPDDDWALSQGTVDERNEARNPLNAVDFVHHRVRIELREEAMTITETAERCYHHCVAGDDCNPMSHGAVTITETRSDGATRLVNANFANREFGAWKFDAAH